MNSCLSATDYLDDSIPVKNDGGTLFDQYSALDGSIAAIMEKASTNHFSDDESDGEELDLDVIIETDSSQFSQREKELGDIMEMMRKTSIDEPMAGGSEDPMASLDGMGMDSLLGDQRKESSGSFSKGSIDSLLAEHHRKGSSGDSMAKGSMEVLMDGMHRSSLDEVVEMLAIDNSNRPSFEVALDALNRDAVPSSSDSPGSVDRTKSSNHWRSRSENDLGKISLNDAMQMNQIFEAAYLEPDGSEDKSRGSTTTEVSSSSGASRSGSESSRSGSSGGVADFGVVGAGDFNGTRGTRRPVKPNSKKGKVLCKGGSSNSNLKRGRTSSMEASANRQRAGCEKKISTSSSKSSSRPNSMFEAPTESLGAKRPGLERSISAPLIRKGRPGEGQSSKMPPQMPMPFGMPPWMPGMPMPGMPLPNGKGQPMMPLGVGALAGKNGVGAMHVPTMPGGMPMPGMPMPPSMKLQDLKNMPMPMMPMPPMKGVPMAQMGPIGHMGGIKNQAENMKNMPNVSLPMQCTPILPMPGVMPGMPIPGMPMPPTGGGEASSSSSSSSIATAASGGASSGKCAVGIGADAKIKPKTTLPKPPFPMLPMFGPRGFIMHPMSMGLPMMPLPFLNRMSSKSSGEAFVKARGGYKCGRCGQQKAGHDCPYKSKAKAPNVLPGEKAEEELKAKQEEEERAREERDDSKVVYGRCMAVQCDLNITAPVLQASA